VVLIVKRRGRQQWYVDTTKRSSQCGPLCSIESLIAIGVEPAQQSLMTEWMWFLGTFSSANTDCQKKRYETGPLFGHDSLLAAWPTWNKVDS
jgi:hypothetical protein